MCFRITLKKNDENIVEYLGDNYDSIEKDKKALKLIGITDSRGNTILYKVIITLPNVTEKDVQVTSYSLLQNPTNRKPITGPTRKMSTIANNTKCRFLKDLFSEQSKCMKKVKEDNRHKYDNFVKLIEDMESYYRYDDEIDSKIHSPYLIDTSKENLENKSEYKHDDTGIKFEEDELNDISQKAMKYALISKWTTHFLDRIIKRRYEELLKNIKVSIAFIALKTTLNLEKETNKSESKLNLAYGDINLKPSDSNSIPKSLETKELEFLIPRKLPKKRKGSTLDATANLKKLLLTIENKPEVLDLPQISSLTKSMDAEPASFVDYLQLLGLISIKNEKLKLNPPLM